MGGDVARRLRRTVLAEVVLGVVVLGVTATLVNAAPARVALRPAGRRHRGRACEGGRVQLHMEPAKQGENVADIYLRRARTARLFVPPEIEARLRRRTARTSGAAGRAGRRRAGPLRCDRG